MTQDDTGTDLRKLTLDELRATRNEMLCLENMDIARDAGHDTARMCFDTISAIQDVIRDLENAGLSQLLKELRSHESALREGIDDLKGTRKNIERVGTFLGVANKALRLVGKAVSAIA